MSLTYSKVGKKKLAKKWKVLLPIYGICFAIFGLGGSVWIDVYYATHATKYDPSKLDKLIALCAVTDIAIWGAVALVLVFATAIGVLIVEGVRMKKKKKNDD